MPQQQQLSVSSTAFCCRAFISITLLPKTLVFQHKASKNSVDLQCSRRAIGIDETSMIHFHNVRNDSSSFFFRQPSGIFWTLISEAGSLMTAWACEQLRSWKPKNPLGSYLFLCCIGSMLGLGSWTSNSSNLFEVILSLDTRTQQSGAFLHFAHPSPQQRKLWLLPGEWGGIHSLFCAFSGFLTLLSSLHCVSNCACTIW